MELLPPGSQLNEKQREFEKYKERYEKLKCDVGVKMQFLEENQVGQVILPQIDFVHVIIVQTKVMKKQLLLFHNAIAAYFSGNQQALDATMKQFNLKVVSNGELAQEKRSFLEQSHH